MVHVVADDFPAREVAGFSGRDFARDRLRKLGLRESDKPIFEARPDFGPLVLEFFDREVGRRRGGSDFVHRRQFVRDQAADPETFGDEAVVQSGYYGVVRLAEVAGAFFRREGGGGVEEALGGPGGVTSVAEEELFCEHREIIGAFGIPALAVRPTDWEPPTFFRSPTDSRRSARPPGLPR